MIDVAGVAKGVLDGLLGDLVEGDTLDLLALFRVGPQLEREVVGDGFAFAVRVRRQEDFVCLGGQLLELVDDFLFAGRDHQLGLERAMLEFDANVVLRQVHDVAD